MAPMGPSASPLSPCRFLIALLGKQELPTGPRVVARGRGGAPLSLLVPVCPPPMGPGGWGTLCVPTWMGSG